MTDEEALLLPAKPQRPHAPWHVALQLLQQEAQHTLRLGRVVEHLPVPLDALAHSTTHPHRGAQ